MNYTDRTSKDYTYLIDQISKIILEKGLKSTTMDLVASRLSMSKRTLYEIFENKNAMIAEIIRFNKKRHLSILEQTFRDAPDMMTAMIKLIGMQRNHIKDINANFFRDMDSYYEELRPYVEEQNNTWNSGMMQVIQCGINEGVFRKEVNYNISLILVHLQFESLKRMEEHFPKGITVAEAYDNICIGFLRSIATQKGMAILEDSLK